jgi:4-hydroxy-L-threonine phosphate dehydrogenase PdxA
MSAETLPILAITLGDPAGTGPEIIAKGLALPEIHSLCRPLIVGDAAVLTQALRFVGSSLKVRAFASVAEAPTRPTRSRSSTSKMWISPNFSSAKSTPWPARPPTST